LARTAVRPKRRSRADLSVLEEHYSARATQCVPSRFLKSLSHEESLRPALVSYLTFNSRARWVGIILSRQVGHRKGDGTRCKGYCFRHGGKLANSKGDGARCHRSFDSWGLRADFRGPSLCPRPSKALETLTGSYPESFSVAEVFGAQTYSNDSGGLSQDVTTAAICSVFR
jgi:hypothetical protein